MNLRHTAHLRFLTPLLLFTCLTASAQDTITVHALDRALTLDENLWPQLVCKSGALDVIHSGSLKAHAEPEEGSTHQLIAFARRNYGQMFLDLPGRFDTREMEALRFGHRERVTDMEFDHIRDLPKFLPDLFASAALRAKTAGFDGVELHYAHAYTMASFLSRTNTRDDDYGGSLEGRARLPLEVIAAARRAVGADYTLGCRFLAEECIEGGSTAEDAAYFGVAFARAGLDFLSTSRGGKFDDAKQPGVGASAYPYTGPSGYECMPQYISDEKGPFGRNVAATAAIRRAVREAGFDTPVVCTGGVHNFDMAEKMLADGVCDIVGSARQSLADPDWMLKLSRGAGASVRLCEFTNYCEGLDQKHKAVTCQLWDKIDLKAPGVRLTPDGKRRLVPPDWTPA